MGAAVLLVNPRFPHNVGNALRACALLGANDLFWTGGRVPAPERWLAGSRLPREERMKCYANTRMTHFGPSVRPFHAIGRRPDLRRVDFTPVCVEISDQAEDLRDFVHPENPIYTFSGRRTAASRRASGRSATASCGSPRGSQRSERRITSRSPSASSSMTGSRRPQGSVALQREAP